jgi:hypothetical protein
VRVVHFFRSGDLERETVGLGQIIAAAVRPANDIPESHTPTNHFSNGLKSLGNLPIRLLKETFLVLNGTQPQCVGDVAVLFVLLELAPQTKSRGQKRCQRAYCDEAGAM